LQGYGGRADSLTALRWFAALGVFFFHAAPNLTPLALMRPLMRVGYEGVPFFFVLSGFVLTWSARPSDTIRNFYARRFARVWPLLAFTTLPALAIVHYWNHGHISPLSVLITLTLTQSWTHDSFYTVNIVTWTLSCEAFFYLCHPLLMRLLSRLRNLGLLAVSCVMVAIIVLSRVWPGSDAFSFETVRLTYASPLALIPMFIVGMCTALAVRRGWRPILDVNWILALLALVIVLRWRSAYQPGLIPLLPPSAQYFDAVVIPFFALLIAAAAIRDVERGGGRLAHPVLVRLGEWSFAFYLIHTMVLNAFTHYGLMTRLHSAGDRVTVMMLILAAAVTFASACHLMVEKPADRTIRRWLTSAPLKRPPAPSEDRRPVLAEVP
jgi:peptidoglycan/LPS O-acetylase OafA/YrhL